MQNKLRGSLVTQLQQGVSLGDGHQYRAEKDLL